MDGKQDTVWRDLKIGAFIIAGCVALAWLAAGAHYGTLEPCGMVREQAARKFALTMRADLVSGEAATMLGAVAAMTMLRESVRAAIADLGPVQCSAIIARVWITDTDVGTATRKVRRRW